MDKVTHHVTIHTTATVHEAATISVVGTKCNAEASRRQNVGGLLTTVGSAWLEDLNQPRLAEDETTRGCDHLCTQKLRMKELKPPHLKQHRFKNHIPSRKSKYTGRSTFAMSRLFKQYPQRRTQFY